MSSGPPIAVGPFYGAFYFSAIISVAFYGVTCMQTFFYYIHYQDDQLQTKLFVALMWAFDTMHQGLIISGVYKSLMSGLVNQLAFLYVIPELVWELLLSTLVSVPTQGFFVYRIYIFSNKNLIAPLVWLPLGLWQLIACLLYVGKGSNAILITTLGDSFFTGIAVSYCAVAAAVDIMIALCLTYLLARRRLATEFKNSARILQLLTVFAINSGIWTALFALLTIVLLRAFPSELIYCVFDFPLCSIYCNTLLANLNARSYIKGQPSTVNAGADIITYTRGSTTKNNSDQGTEPKFFASTFRGTKNPDTVMTAFTTDSTFQGTKNSDMVMTTFTTDPTQSTKAPAL